MTANLTASLPGSSQQDNPNPAGWRSEASPGRLELIMAKQLGRLERRAKQPLVWLDDGAFFIRTRSGLPPYEITTAAVSTEALLLGWIVHLCDKVWFTKEKCSVLIETVHEHWGKKVQF